MTSNLVDATVNKVEDKIKKLIKLRKNIISNTNNFREFKEMKSDIIHQLVEYEGDFRQLTTIISSVTQQNIIQKENSDLKQNNIDRIEQKLKFSEKENLQILETNQELQKRLGLVNNSNSEKDNKILELNSKISFLENIIKDYQNRYDIIRYPREPYDSRILQHRYDTYSYRNIDNVKFQNNNLYKKDLNLNYEYEFGGGLQRNEFFSTSYNFKPKSSYINQLHKDPSENYNRTNEKFYNTNKNNFTEKNYKNNFDSPRENNITEQNNLNNYDKEQENFIVKIQGENIDDLKGKTIEIQENKLNSNNFSNSNGAFFNNEALTRKNLSEKDKANLVSELLLKIFSSDNINYTLKRKYGEDFQFKLTDKNIESIFLQEIEKDVNLLINKEKIDNKKLDGINYKDIRKSLTNSPVTPAVAMSPTIKKNILDLSKNLLNNNFDSNTKDFNKNNIIPNTTRSAERKDISKVSQINYKDLQMNQNINNGHGSLKDYFVSNANFSKGLNKSEAKLERYSKK